MSKLDASAKMRVASGGSGANPSVGRDFNKGSNPAGGVGFLKKLPATKAGESPSGGTPGRDYAKKGQDSKMSQSAHSKAVKEQKIDIHRGEAASIFDAPTSRVYTNDYLKKGRAPDDKDVVSKYLGNPLKL